MVQVQDNPAPAPVTSWQLVPMGDTAPSVHLSRECRLFSVPGFLASLKLKIPLVLSLRVDMVQPVVGVLAHHTYSAYGEEAFFTTSSQ